MNFLTVDIFSCVTLLATFCRKASRPFRQVNWLVLFWQLPVARTKAGYVFRGRWGGTLSLAASLMVRQAPNRCLARSSKMYPLGYPRTLGLQPNFLTRQKLNAGYKAWHSLSRANRMPAVEFGQWQPIIRSYLAIVQLLTRIPENKN